MPIGASAQETESGNDTEYGTTSDAEGAAVEVSTETELIAALANGGNIMLTGDITASDDYEISKNTAIDLNGHTITGVGVFCMSGYEENIVLTISGNGTVKNTNPNFTSAIHSFLHSQSYSIWLWSKLESIILCFHSLLHFLQL